MTRHDEINWLAQSLKWSARLVSSGYLAFFLFMLIAHLIPPGEPFGTLTLRESLGFVFVGVYFLGNLIAWKAQGPGAGIGLAGVIGFCFAVAPKLHLPLWMVVPCLLYLAAAATHVFSRARP
ncbi:MAG: hypothetical protein R3C19_06860 [Planctomycetaceae bacterium]